MPGRPSGPSGLWRSTSGGTLSGGPGPRSSPPPAWCPARCSAPGARRSRAPRVRGGLRAVPRELPGLGRAVQRVAGCRADRSGRPALQGVGLRRAPGARQDTANHASSYRGRALAHGGRCARAAGRAWRGSSPRTEVACTETHCIYERLWYNNGHFYLLVDGDEPVVRRQPSSHLPLAVSGPPPLNWWPPVKPTGAQRLGT
jgi:hypothetical protein